MLIWIFDLDHTLYHMQEPFLYSKLKQDKYLDFLLSMIPGKKVIFTNATLEHAELCLNIIGIRNHFSAIEARDTLNGLKPDPIVFKSFIQKMDIKKNDLCVFFEDTINNLIVSKAYFKWGTIYINKSKESDKHVDIKFDTIHNCLEYFAKKFI